MNIHKSTKYFCTLLLLGQFTSTAAAQTIKPENITTAKQAQQNSKTISSLKRFKLLNSQLRTLREANFKSDILHSQLSLPNIKTTQKITQTPEVKPEKGIYITPRIGAQFTTGSGVGYDSSYTSVEGFVPLVQNPGKDLTFIQGKLHLATTDTLASGNLTLGHRLYSTRDNRVIGGYIAYDARNTGNNKFNQVGAGFESLGESWDARANLYIPVNDTRQVSNESISETSSPLSVPQFQENFLVQTRNVQRQVNRRFEVAMKGIDIEAGVKLANIGTTGDVRGYAGLYYYNASNNDEIFGGRARLEVNPNDALKLGVLLSNDSTFGTNLVFSVGASLPGTRPVGLKKNSVLARFGESIVRNDNIIIKEQQESTITSLQETILLTNPATGQPWEFQHVNLGIGTGNGTFENPTGTVAEALNIAQANDIVYVQAGINPGIPGFTIPNSVQVLSTGVVQQINTVEAGTIQLPLSGTGTLPTITGTVTMGNNTTLSGFAIASGSNPGIFASNIGNFTIRNNTITSPTAQGILLENVRGEVAITNNTIQDSGINGLQISNNQGKLDLNLTGNTIRNNGIGSINENGEEIIDENGDENIDGDGIEIIDGEGIEIIDGDGIGRINENAIQRINENAIQRINENAIQRISGNGVDIELSNTATGTFNFINNTIADNTSINGVANGVNIQLLDSANSTFNFAKNVVTNNAGQGITIALEASANGTFNLTDNNLANNTLSGLSVLLSNNSQGNFKIANNTITNNKIQGIDFLLADSSSGFFNISSNTITDNRQTGVNIVLSNTAQGDINISNNPQISLNGLYGIFASANDNSQLRLTVDSNSIDYNTSNFAITSFNTAKIFAAVRSNNIIGNAGISDFEVVTYDSANICLQAKNNQINDLFINDLFGGILQIEGDLLTANMLPSTGIGISLSATSVPAGTCGF